MSPKRPLVPTRGQAGGAGQSARARMETRHRGARCAGGALIPGTWTRTSMGCEGGRKLVGRRPGCRRNTAHCADLDTYDRIVGGSRYSAPTDREGAAHWALEPGHPPQPERGHH